MVIANATPAKALTQNKAICSATCHTALCNPTCKIQRSSCSMASSHRQAAAGVDMVQLLLQRLVFRVFADIGPEGAGGHDAAAGKL